MVEWALAVAGVALCAAVVVFAFVVPHVPPEKAGDNAAATIRNRKRFPTCTHATCKHKTLRRFPCLFVPGHEPQGDDMAAGYIYWRD